MILQEKQFIGLDLETEPGNLQPGYYNVGENIRCNRGVVESRGGHQATTWTKNTSEIYSSDWSVANDGWNEVELLGASKGNFDDRSDGTFTRDNCFGMLPNAQDAEHSINRSGVMDGDAAYTLVKIEYLILSQNANVDAIRLEHDGGEVIDPGSSHITKGDLNTLDSWTDCWIKVPMNSTSSILHVILMANGETVFRGDATNGEVVYIASLVTVAIKEPLGTVYGFTPFRDPALNEEFLLVATADKAYIIEGGKTAKAIEYPDGESVSSDVEMIQAFDEVYLFRGATAWRWNTNTRDNFFEVEDGAGTSYSFPEADFGTYFENRLVVNQDDDTLLISNVLAPNVFASGGQFFINQGSDDVLVDVIPFSKQRLVVFKGQTVFLINANDTDINNWTVELVSSDYGLVARNAVISIGGDVYFLAKDGIRTLSQIADTRFEATALPLSENIKPVFDRVNWEAIDEADMIYYKNRFFVSLPLDSDTRCNHVIVYNFTNQAWESIDNSAQFSVKGFTRFNFAGEQKLMALSHDGYVYFYDYDFDAQDSLSSTESSDVTSVCQTLGRGAEDIQHRKTIRGKVTLATWSPRFSVDLVQEGVNEVISIFSNKTRSRTNYLTYGDTDWDDTNVNDDFDTPYREDYSILADGDGIELHDGIQTNLVQETNYPFRARGISRSPMIKVTNDKGHFELRGVWLEWRAKQRKQERV